MAKKPLENVTGDVNRRQILGTVAAGSVGLLTGCLNDNDGTEYATMQRLVLLNNTSSDVTVTLRIEREDSEKVVHEENYSLPGGFDGVAVECVWPDSPLRVMTRKADAKTWRTLTTVDRSGCMIVYSETNDSGIRFYTSTDSCPVRSADCHTNVES
jgi:hypothetical protein